LNYFPRYFTSKAIALYLVVLIACLLFFSGRWLPLLWIIFGVLEVITFFYYSNYFTRTWSEISVDLFQRVLFNTSLAIRLLYVILIYFFYEYITGQPFEFEARDSIGYHNEAVWIVDMFESGTIGYYFNEYLKGVSDSGFPLWLSVIYYFSAKSILVARLVDAVVSAWMVVLIYKIASRNFGEAAGRISAILAMLLPVLIIYYVLHKK